MDVAPPVVGVFRVVTGTLTDYWALCLRCAATPPETWVVSARGGRGGYPRERCPRTAPPPSLCTALIGLQGTIGWFMVASGLDSQNFEDGSRVRVSHLRLTLHLMGAFTLYSAFVWTAMSMMRPAVLPQITELIAARPYLRPVAKTTLGWTLFTAASGGLVAGLDAGLVYNEWPTMAGPSDARAQAMPSWCQREMGWGIAMRAQGGGGMAEGQRPKNKFVYLKSSSKSFRFCPEESCSDVGGSAGGPRWTPPPPPPGSTQLYLPASITYLPTSAVMYCIASTASS